MKKIQFTFYAALLLLGLSAGSTAWAQSDYPEYADTMGQPTDMSFSADELDALLAPIALYPDPLLAQILPAATFIDQIDEAARYVRQYGNSVQIDDQPWDVSVKAVAHYPDVLFMMDQKYDWTVSLGQAFINQQQDVMDAIQRLRAEAQDEGNLSTTPQQAVVDEDGYIRIVPAQPEMIYVPQYDPFVVYMESSPSYGFITFSIGFSIGAWLDRDCDWHGRRIFYHGWQGGGWVGRARPYIHDQRNIYINKTYSVINVNRKVIRHSTDNFRDELRRNAWNRQKQIHPQASRTRNIQPGGGTGKQGQMVRPPTTVTRPTTTITHPATTVTHPTERPDNKALYRGREIKGAQPSAGAGYGGYGSKKDAATYSERGRSSRGTMGQLNRQQPRPAQNPRPAPAQRPAINQGRQPAPGQVNRPAPHQASPTNRSGAEKQQHP
jgi:hypothetical protein